MTTALVIIDVQNGMVSNPGNRPHDDKAVVGRIAALIARARAAGRPVFYVQHDGGADDVLHPGKPGFAICDEIAPRAGDSITVKAHSSAFHGTEFDARLKDAGIDHLVITGMQSEYCVDSSVRGAVERGYRVTLVSDAHSTFDTAVAMAKDIIAIQNNTMKGSFAAVQATAEITF